MPYEVWALIRKKLGLSEGPCEISHGLIVSVIMIVIKV